MRLFFTGEALQRVFVSICNGSTRDAQYKISKVISSMLKTSLCIRLTPIGLAPFRNDVTMIIPYSMMDRVQLDFLDNLAYSATFTPVSSTVYSDPVRALGIGNEVSLWGHLCMFYPHMSMNTDPKVYTHTQVMVITMIDSMRIWSDSNHIPLSHRHISCPLGKSVVVGGDKERIARAKEEANRALKGSPIAGGTHWQLDTLDVLKAFVVCVFRSTQFKDREMKRGICDIIIQMVIHDVGLTQNIVNLLGEFIEGILLLE